MRPWTLIMAALLLGSGAGQAQELQLQVSPVVVEPDSLVTLEVRVDGAVAGLRGYTLDLHYDRDVASVFSIYEGEVMLAHTPTFFYWEDLGDNSHSLIHVDHAILGGLEGGEGPGALFHVTLRGEGCGIESLWVDNALFRDLDNDALAVSLGTAVEHQVCQVPRLHIARNGDGSMLLTWDRVLNAQEYHLWTRPRWEQPWLPLATVTDTSWTDPGTPGPGSRLYRLSLLHD